MSWTEQPLLALDFESTGVNPTECRPVTFALVQLDPKGAVTDAWGAVVDCGVEVPDEAAAVHGYTTERVRKEGQRADHALKNLLTILEGGRKDGFPLCMFNARYDWTLLHAEAERYGLEVPVMPILDPFVIDRKVDKYRKGSRKLTAVAEHYGVVLDDAHEATADATAAGRVMQRIPELYPRIGKMTLPNLYQHQVAWFRLWRDGFNEYLTRQHGENADLVTGEWPR